MEDRYDDALTHIRKAVQVAPGSADAATFACFILAFSGFSEEAVLHGERAMTLSPNYPGYYLGILGNAYRLAARFEEAISAFNAFNVRNAGFGLTDLVIIYQQTGRPEEAKQPAGQLLSVR
ncbi:MAG: tetratricopeptide repeat protein [Arenicellales bacterium]